MQVRSWLVRRVVIGLVCAAVAGLVYEWQPMRGLDDWTLDAFIVARGDRATAARVVLVLVDEDEHDARGKSLLYYSPELADAVTYLRGQHAAAIGIDILVPESRWDDPELQPSPPGRPRTRGDVSELSKQILAAPDVVIPVHVKERHSIRPVLQWRARHELYPDPGHTDVGFANVEADPDGFVRRQQLAGKLPAERPGEDDELVFQFGLALLAKAEGRTLAWVPETRSVTLDGKPIPLDADQMMRINFAGPHDRFWSVRLADLLNRAAAGQATPEVDGAIVIIGVSAGSGRDWHNTPFANGYARVLGSRAGPMCGPELHANVIATVWDQAFVRGLGPGGIWACLVAVGLACGLAMPRSCPVRGFAATAAGAVGWVGVSYAAFAGAHLRLPVLAPLLALGLIYVGLQATRLQVLRRLLGEYQGVERASELERQPDRSGAGTTVVLTVLFADIRGFTAWSDGKSPELVSALLNAYFDTVVPAIKDSGGMVDKFIGDGVMAVFGALGTFPGHAAAAIRAAREIVRRVADGRGRWESFDFAHLAVGVGVHTGPAAVGSVGAEDRKDFTAIGDTVNTASRLEALTKQLCTPVVVSANTVAAAAGSEIPELELVPEPVSVRGMATPLSVYRLPAPTSESARNLKIP